MIFTVRRKWPIVSANQVLLWRRQIVALHLISRSAVAHLTIPIIRRHFPLKTRSTTAILLPALVCLPRAQSPSRFLESAFKTKFRRRLLGHSKLFAMRAISTRLAWEFPRILMKVKFDALPRPNAMCGIRCSRPTTRAISFVAAGAVLEARNHRPISACRWPV